MADWSSGDSTNLDDNKIKLVGYYIVSIRPGAERILPNGIGSVMVTKAMTEDEFVAWVIALYFQTEEGRKAVKHTEKQYLRVSYSVADRWDKPCEDWEEDRVRVLRSINRNLFLDSHWPPEASPSAEETMPPGEEDGPSHDEEISPSESEEDRVDSPASSPASDDSDDPAAVQSQILEALTKEGRFLTLEELAELCEQPAQEIKVGITELKHQGRIRQVVNRYGLPKSDN